MATRMPLIRAFTGMGAAIAALNAWAVTPTRALDWFASEVISYSRLGNDPYDDPYATLGKPSVWMNASGAPGDRIPCAVSMICPAWGLGWPNGEKLITTLRPGNTSNPPGQITVKFATPVYDDPSNWYGKDFIVYGNSMFSLSGGYVYSQSNMEDMILSAAGAAGMWVEPAPVSVSQDGVTWYEFTNGPYADDYAPTHALAWDWVENTWLANSTGEGVEMDFTRPVSPNIHLNAFASISCAQAIDLYRGSGGGTAFDLADLPDLPVDPVTGRKWIQYIRVTGAGAEVDAFARVSPRLEPISIAQAKLLPDNTNVVIRDCVVSAETYTTGRLCHVADNGMHDGIRVHGRVFARNQRYTLYGRMDTVDGQRVLLCTGAELQGTTEPVQPVQLTNAQIGPEWSGSLVQTIGVVIDSDPDLGVFTIDDRTGQTVRCQSPRLSPASLYANPTNPDWGTAPRSGFPHPQPGEFVRCTGIVELADRQPVLKLRDNADLSACAGISGHLTLEGLTTAAMNSTPITVTLQHVDSGALETRTIRLDADGRFDIPVEPARYRIGFRAAGWLQAIYRDASGSDVIDTLQQNASDLHLTLMNGDINGDNVINMGDYMPMRSSWLSRPGDPQYLPHVDLNRDGQVNMGDYLLLRKNWLKRGDSFQPITP